MCACVCDVHAITVMCVVYVYAFVMCVCGMLVWCVLVMCMSLCYVCEYVYDVYGSDNLVELVSFTFVLSPRLCTRSFAC